MNDEPVRYLGVEIVGGAREYRFRVNCKPASHGERIFFMRIAAASFSPGKLTFQDGPEIASRKLRAMLQTEQDNHPLAPHQELSESDIADYAVSGKLRHKAWTEEQKVAARIRAGQSRRGQEP